MQRNLIDLSSWQRMHMANMTPPFRIVKDCRSANQILLLKERLLSHRGSTSRSSYRGLVKWGVQFLTVSK